MVVGTFDHLIRYYEDINTAVDSYNLTQKLSEATGAISSVKLSNNGGYLYTASLDGYLRIYYQCLSGCKQCDEFLKCGECLEQYNMNSGVCISDNTPIEKNNVLSIALHSVFGVLLLVGIVCVLIFC